VKSAGWTNRVAHTAVIAGKPCSYNSRGEGHFPALPRQAVTEHPPMLLVETHLLELADHAHQD
jgi:hypothetical protein